MFASLTRWVAWIPRARQPLLVDELAELIPAPRVGAKTCPACGSPDPVLYPAVGAEVVDCPHPWHGAR